MTSVSRGRPQASSREMLADAASELFLEQGYEATTVVDITRRAGVSRSTFFNYFDGKAATIWFALDEHLAHVKRVVVEQGSPIRTALGTLVAQLGAAPPHTLALAITNADVMGVADELRLGRAVRQASLAEVFARALRVDLGTHPVRAEIEGAGYAAAVFAAIAGWAERGAGSSRIDAVMTEALAIRALSFRAPSIRAQSSSASEEPHDTVLRVAVIGHGAIGGRVIEELAAGRIAGAQLAGVVTRRPGALAEAFPGVEITDFGQDLERAITESDLVVECAGIAAARAYGPAIVQAGRALHLVSIGALADEEARAALTSRPGALTLSSGAIGGLDLLAAAARPGGIPGGISRASITSTKRAATLVQQWMSEEEAQDLRDATGPFELFSGTVAEAVEKFPGSLNVACALAQATGLWDETRVTLVADPHGVRTVHEIAAGGNAGEYAFRIENAVSPVTPTSSLVVAESVLAEIASFAR